MLKTLLFLSGPKSLMAISSKPMGHSRTRAASRTGNQVTALRIGITTLMAGSVDVRWNDRLANGSERLGLE